MDDNSTDGSGVSRGEVELEDDKEGFIDWDKAVVAFPREDEALLKSDGRWPLSTSGFPRKVALDT